MNKEEKEKIIKSFDFFNIQTEERLQEEIADMVYLIVTSTRETIEPLTNKIFTNTEFYKKILPCLEEDLEEVNFLGYMVKCAKKIYETEKIETVLDTCSIYINKAFDELGIIIVKDFSSIFDMLEIKDFKIIFPLKWFSPDVYKSVTEFLKTFKCKRCKVGKQTAFKNQGEFSNEQILKIGKELKGVSLSTKFDFFPTPAELVKKVHSLVEIKSDDLILEPSAGAGDLIRGLDKKNIVCVELNSILATILKEKKYNVKNIAFEDFEPEQKFDKILMNPPFSKRLDAKHILRAFEMLKNGGELVAIHSCGILYATDKISTEFRNLCDKYKVYQEKIPDGMFADSAKGTKIETCITKFVKD